jgi:hypothetical protein
MTREKTKTKNRTLFYRRVIWDGKATSDLQKLFAKAHSILKTTEQRTFQYNDIEIQGLKIKHNHDKGSLCHIASYFRGQPTSLVPDPSDKEETNTLVRNPPSKHNFMEGDIFFLLNGNHIVLCPSGVRESIAIAYIANVLQNAFQEGAVPSYSIQPVADINKIKLLQQEGVKNIILSSSLYEASSDYVERKTVRETLLSSVAKEFIALFSKDNDIDLKDIDKKENLSVRLVISYDSRKKGGDIGKRRINSVANKLINEGDTDGFLIETGTGKTVTSDEVRLSEKVQINVHGNSISRVDAWEKLDQYLYDLKSSGLLDQ